MPHPVCRRHRLAGSERCIFVERISPGEERKNPFVAPSSVYVHGERRFEQSSARCALFQCHIEEFCCDAFLICPQQMPESLEGAQGCAASPRWLELKRTFSFSGSNNT